MANKALKGLTIKIGGDTSELLDSLNDVEKKGASLSKELGEINKLLKMDPSNTQLLAQKQKVLADSVDNTRKKLDTLKEAEKQVQAQFERGEVSEEQVRALQREIVKTEGKLKSYERAVDETADQLEKLADGADEAADALDDVGDAADDADGGFTVAKGAVAEFIGNGLSSLVGAAKDAIGSVLDLAESTREYRTELAKLKTAASVAGTSTDYIKDKWHDLGAVLGDEGAVAEGLNNLMAAGYTTEEELDAITKHLEGAAIKWKDTLKFEGLSDGLQETLATGSAVGSFGEMLERSGVNLETFNEGLANCKTEADKQNYVLQELSKLGLSDVSDAYREQNADLIASNKATAENADLQAELGAAIEPLSQKLTELKTKAMQWLIEKGLPGLQKGIKWVKDNIPTLVTIVGALTAAWLTFGGAQKLIDKWNKIVAVSQAALNAVQNANPIGLIVMAVMALVAAFIYLWNNCEAFREFWIKLWEGIKKAAKAVADWFVEAWENVSSFFSNMWTKLGDGARNAWQGIKDTFSKVGTFFSETFRKAWEGVKKVFSVGGKIFDGIKDGIVSAFKTVVNAIIRGINKVVKLPFQGLNNVLDSIHNVEIVGVKPFDWLTWRAPIPKIPELARGGVLEKGQVGLLEGDGAEAVVPLEKNTHWLEKVAEKLSGFLVDDLDGLGLERNLRPRMSAVSPAVLALDGLSSKLDSILTAIENGQVLTIDGETLVGATANAMDNALGRRRALAARGAL